MASYKPFFTEEKSKSMIKGAIGGEFKSDFNDEKKTPYIKELEVKKSKKSESYESEFPEESEVLDNPNERKEGERTILLGSSEEENPLQVDEEERSKLYSSIHNKVLDQDSLELTDGQVYFGYTRDVLPQDPHEHNKKEGLSEELVDDSHSTVKRAINADFTDSDFNKEKQKPTLKEPEKKKSKKKESAATYKSIFKEDVYSLIIEIEELDNKIYDLETDRLSGEYRDKLKSALEGLKNSVEQAMDLL